MDLTCINCTFRDFRRGISAIPGDELGSTCFSKGNVTKCNVNNNNQGSSPGTSAIQNHPKTLTLAARKMSGSDALSPQDVSSIQQKFSDLRRQEYQLTQKISELDNERAEHELSAPVPTFFSRSTSFPRFIAAWS